MQTLRIAWEMLISGNFKLRYIWDFILGEYRTLRARPVLDISEKGVSVTLQNPDLLQKHIVEQFEWRLTKMDVSCLNAQSCKECGCTCPNLQFANRGCEGGCYPKMMSKNEWNKFKSRVIHPN